MTIDLSKMTFSDEEIPGLVEDQDNWVPPSEFPMLPVANTYRMFIKEIQDIREYMTSEGPRLACDFTAEILDGPEGSKEYEGRRVMFQSAYSTEYTTKDRGRTSGMLDLVKAAGYTGKVKTNKDFSLVLASMEDNRAMNFRGFVDWEGSCSTCYNQKCMELTKTATADLAKTIINKEQRKEASNFGMKFKNFRTFPLLTLKGKPDDPLRRKTLVECPDCHGEIQARLQIKRFIEKA